MQLFVDGLFVDGLLVDALLVDGPFVDVLSVDGSFVDGVFVDGLFLGFLASSETYVYPGATKRTCTGAPESGPCEVWLEWYRYTYPKRGF